MENLRCICLYTIGFYGLFEFLIMIMVDASWKTYPGPILSSWNDLESYLTTMKQVSR